MFRDVPESGIRDVVLGLGNISGYAGLMRFFFETHMVFDELIIVDPY